MKGWIAAAQADGSAGCVLESDIDFAGTEFGIIPNLSSTFDGQGYALLNLRSGSGCNKPSPPRVWSRTCAS